MKKNMYLISGAVISILNIMNICFFKENSLFSIFFFIVPVVLIAHLRVIYSLSYNIGLIVFLNLYFLYYRNVNFKYAYINLFQLELIFMFMGFYLSYMLNKCSDYKDRIDTYSDLMDYTEKRDEDDSFYDNIIKYTLNKFRGEKVEFLLVNSDRIVKKMISSSKKDVYEVENQLKDKKSLYRRVFEGEKFYTNNINKEQDFNIKSDYNKLMVVPVEIGDETLGILKIESNLRKNYNKKSIKKFCEYSKVLGFIIENHEVYEMGLYDELLEIPTERYVHKKMDQIFDENKKSSILYSIALLDIDNFKKINEFYGSINGDIILKESLKIIKRKMSKDDFIARISGNRFILILENRGKYISKNFLEDLRDEYSNKSFFIKQRKENLTFSVGLVSLPIDNVKNYQELKELLESRLYKAKLSGKNHIIEF